MVQTRIHRSFKYSSWNDVTEDVIHTIQRESKSVTGTFYAQMLISHHARHQVMQYKHQPKAGLIFLL